MTSAGRSIRTLLLAFWAVWFALVAASNLADLAAALGALPAGWRFVSGNYALIEKTTAIYSFPTSANRVLLGLVIAWEIIAAVLLIRALVAHGGGRPAGRPLEQAFAMAAGLFAAFTLADELFIAFEGGLEAAHLRIFIALLVSYLVVRQEAESS